MNAVAKKEWGHTSGEEGAAATDWDVQEARSVATGTYKRRGA